jgi:wobble nucleotide-excising tRNase
MGANNKIVHMKESLVMISRIIMKNAASYKNAARVDFDPTKRCSFFYGLNGVGKSTLSSYLYYYRQIENAKRGGVGASKELESILKKYKDCSITVDPNDEIIVYNRDFINKNFGNQIYLDGIGISVTVGEENNQAETNIENAKTEITRLQGELRATEAEKSRISDERDARKKITQKEVSEYIKKKANEARIQQGQIGSQAGAIWNKLISAGMEAPTETIQSIADKMLQLDNSATPTPTIAFVECDLASIEKDTIWQKNTASSQIETPYSEKSGYSEWLNAGLCFLEGEKEDCTCPFCNTDDRKKLRDFVSQLIGEEYKRDKDVIVTQKRKYVSYIDRISHAYTGIPGFIADDKKNSANEALKTLIDMLNANVVLMEKKEANSGEIVTLSDSSVAVENLKTIITSINADIEANNTALSDSKKYAKDCLEQFWRIMRQDKAGEISIDETDENNTNSQLSAKRADIMAFRTQIDAQNKIIEDNSLVRKDIAYKEINQLLESMGIFDFKLEMIEGKAGSYKIVRPEAQSDEPVYKTLSEGEKTMISFLYFMQVCEGVDSSKKRIVVIDDPISSMSNIFLFNIASLIQREYTKYDKSRGSDQKYAQVIILTHNLNFFYEVLDYDKKRVEKYQ